MITLGYKLSSEEQSATDLVRYAQMTQDTGFGFALISDHFHPGPTGRDRVPSCGVCWAPSLRPRSA